MKPIQCVINDPSTIRRVDRIAKARGHKKLTRTVRELFMERLHEIEQHGDPHALKPNIATPPGRSGTNGVSQGPQSAPTNAAGD